MKVRGLVRTMDGWMVDVKRESQNFHINHDNVDFTEEFQETSSINTIGKKQHLITARHHQRLEDSGAAWEAEVHHVQLNAVSPQRHSSDIWLLFLEHKSRLTALNREQFVQECSGLTGSGGIDRWRPHNFELKLCVTEVSTQSYPFFYSYKRHKITVSSNYCKTMI